MGLEGAGLRTISSEYEGMGRLSHFVPDAVSFSDVWMRGMVDSGCVVWMHRRINKPHLLYQ